MTSRKRYIAAKTVTPLVFLVLLLICSVIHAMDHSKFRKCDQKEFCKELRHRFDTNTHRIESIVHGGHHDRSESTFHFTAVWKKRREEEEEKENEGTSREDHSTDDLLMEIDEPVSGVFRVRMRERVDENDVRIMDRKLQRRHVVQDVITASESDRRSFKTEGELPHVTLRSGTY